MYGDLATVTKLECRFAEVFPNGKLQYTMLIDGLLLIWQTLC